MEKKVKRGRPKKTIKKATKQAKIEREVARYRFLIDLAMKK